MLRAISQSQILKSNAGFIVALILWLLTLISTPITLYLIGDHMVGVLATAGVLTHLLVVVIALRKSLSDTQLILSITWVAVIAFAAEDLGTNFGVLFGHYDYTQRLQPQVAGVPLLILLAWNMMLFPSLAMAQQISPKFKHTWLTRLSITLIAALAMTAWDLYLDPQMTDWGLWIWEDSTGGYFGIPWRNFIGWIVVAGVISFPLSSLKLDLTLFAGIYALTWLFQAVGLGIFWSMPGPAIGGFMGMGIFVLAVFLRRQGTKED